MKKIYFAIKLSVLLSFAFVAYITIVLLSYESYYYCNEKGCLTFVETQKGRDMVIKVYDKRIYSRLQMKNAPYIELYPEYLAYFEESDTGLFIVRSSAYPQVTKGKMSNVQFVISEYECCGTLYSDLSFYMIVF